MSRLISRRTILKGMGTAVALPYLEAMSAIAAVPSAAPAKPVRAAFLYIPNGAHLEDWTPTATGTNYTLPYVLEPLKPFQQDINVLTGLTLDKARPNGDGPGDHARAMAAFLTGRQPRKTNGADIRLGQSADQWIAGQIGDKTKFASLEIGIEPGRPAGNCDSGYSCAYQSNFSWRNDTTPNAKEVNPKSVFDRLFGNGPSKDQDAARAKRDQYNKSILDFVREDTKSLSTQLGAGDQRKLDEYLTSIRELEVRIDKSNETKNSKVTPPPDVKVPAGLPKDFQEHVHIMADLMVVAFQADITRVVTFPLANDGSNRPYPYLSARINDKDEAIREGHHELSHHGNDKAKQAKIRRINRYHIEQLAYLLTRLQSIKEGDKTLLDQTMLVYGSGNSDGNRHNHDNLPILLCGHGGGKIKTGQHLRYAKDTPLMNLYLAMFQAMGCPAKSFGDSTGVLAI
ncbi:MAG: DUF1552 domain-containing protein [Planctomycetes bacterium]|nr:DUF1552 domain-containing protein [Planctomycetota bacterium]